MAVRASEAGPPPSVKQGPAPPMDALGVRLHRAAGLRSGLCFTNAAENTPPSSLVRKDLVGLGKKKKFNTVKPQGLAGLGANSAITRGAPTQAGWGPATPFYPLPDKDATSFGTSRRNRAASVNCTRFHRLLVRHKIDVGF